jgi:hypothetical protein
MTTSEVTEPQPSSTPSVTDDLTMPICSRIMGAHRSITLKIISIQPLLGDRGYASLKSSSTLISDMYGCARD